MWLIYKNKGVLEAWKDIKSNKSIDSQIIANKFNLKIKLANI